MIQRTKTWKHVRKSDNQIEDDVNKVKSRVKKYDTRRKRHIESNKRRENVLEQLIDNVGTGGVLSGSFLNSEDAYNKLTALQELHSSAFNGWMNSGRGSLVNVIQNDLTTTWLDDIIPNNPTTQAVIPWMIDLTFRSYIQNKLKGDIK
jgi:hypothetical protein